MDRVNKREFSRLLPCECTHLVYNLGQITVCIARYFTSAYLNIIVPFFSLQEPVECRKSSKYEIYGRSTRPFGEGYRKSVLHREDRIDPEDTSVDTDSVEDRSTMGCSDSKSTAQEAEKTGKCERNTEGVSKTESTTQVEERAADEQNTTGCSESKTTVQAEDLKEDDRNSTGCSGSNKTVQTADHEKADERTGGSLQSKTTSQEAGHENGERNTDNVNRSEKAPNDSEFDDAHNESKSGSDILYNTEIRNINDNNGHSAVAVYSEVKKMNHSSLQTPREKLMQQIRERKTGEHENGQIGDNVQRATQQAETKEFNGNDSSQKEMLTERNNSADLVKEKEDKTINTNVTSSPCSFIEEEYCYEPSNEESTSRLVVRSRSLANLDLNRYKYNSTLTCTLKRPNTLKMTTKPDGTIRYGYRQESSESNLPSNELDVSSTQASEVRTNYVNIIKNAFDAVIESRNLENVKRADAFDGLRQYFHDNKQGLQELLVNNNVVLIEPFRADKSNGFCDKTEGGSPRTCRIAGATVKSPSNEHAPASNTLPRRHTKLLHTNRQGFYHPIKVNKSLIDEELPDPDKVRTARELFQKVEKSNSPPATKEDKSECKKVSNNATGKSRVRPEVKVLRVGKVATNDKRRPVPEQGLREDIKRYPVQKRWTDSGSLSSGVSSDFSCDHDWDFRHYNEESNGGSNRDVLEGYNSDDHEAELIYSYDDNERHPVSVEVLQKIRACGTTVTYYGGKVIARSHGQLRSPMTMSIMDEIRQSAVACEGRKHFEPENDEPYLGVKFRLVKSNSCGSRLEIAGTEEDHTHRFISPRHENYRGKRIEEEVVEARNEDNAAVEFESTLTLEKPDETEETEEGQRKGLLNEREKVKEHPASTPLNEEEDTSKPPLVMTWAEIKLKDARKQWHYSPEAVRLPSQDMEFETFEVLDESSHHKPEKTETTGRG